MLTNMSKPVCTMSLCNIIPDLDLMSAEITRIIRQINKNTNWNYMQMWGTNVILPFKAGNWLDSRLTLVGMQVHQRCDDFFDIPFNRRKWMFNSSLDNTFKVGKNLAFELIGSIQTPMIQEATEKV